MFQWLFLYLRGGLRPERDMLKRSYMHYYKLEDVIATTPDINGFRTMPDGGVVRLIEPIKHGTGCYVERDAEIHDHCHFGNGIRVSRDCVIGTGTQIKNHAYIMAHNKIGKGCVVETGVVIHKGNVFVDNTLISGDQ